MTDTHETKDQLSHRQETEHAKKIKGLTNRFTRLLAASTVSHPDFPSEHLLPRVTEIPFNNLGHQSLVDHVELSELTWGAFYDLKKAKERHGAWGKSAVWGLVAGAAVFVVALLFAVPLGGLIVGVVLGLIVFFSTQDPYTKVAAKIKANYAKKLIDNEDISSQPDLRTRAVPLADVGNGILTNERTLVFFANDKSQRFPGLGWLGAEELFVCPTKELASDAPANHQDIAKSVKDALSSLSTTSSELLVTAGWAVVVDMGTIAPNSKWLDEHSRPLLYIDNPSESDYLSLDSLDESTSARTYFGVQIFLPKHLTLASVFVRPFLASTSAAFEVSVLTLGPPTKDEGDIRRSIHIFEQRLEKKESSGEATQQAAKASSPANSGQTSFLKDIRKLFEGLEDPFSKKSDYGLVETYEWHDKEGLKSEKEEAKKLRDELNTWVGRFVGERNWREANSLTMSQDFFGRSECRATVRALYDQVVRHVLEAFDEQGFDISQFRDSSGRWSINVDKIDQMIVGERVSVHDAVNKAAKSGSAEPQE